MSLSVNILEYVCRCNVFCYFFFNSIPTYVQHQGFHYVRPKGINNKFIVLLRHTSFKYISVVFFYYLRNSKTRIIIHILKLRN